MSDNYWQDDHDDNSASRVPRDIVDLVFRMQCRAVPIDHAHHLHQAITGALPWFDDDPDSGLHIIHGADSGNGWFRPEGGDELLYLTRRTKLELRVPAHRVDDTRGLTGVTLEVAGNVMEIGEATIRPLSAITTLYTRYLITEEGQDESEFLAQITVSLKAIGVRARKLLPGRANLLSHPDGAIHTRSLMIADLDLADTIRLQERGLGPGRKMGCGLFIPHKAIKTTVPDA